MPAEQRSNRLPPSRAAFFLAVATGLAQATLQRNVRLHPELEPESDKKFFKKDYPWDKRPGVDKRFGFDHPYPAVQDTSDFDRDYVKDENADGGQFQAQMDYDTLRHKIRQADKKLSEAKAKLDKKEAEWKASKDAYDTSSVDADSSGSLKKKRAQEADAAKSKVNQLEGSSSADGTKVGGAIGDAIKKVDKEMADLEDCKKELAAAKKRLKAMMKKKEEFEKKEAREAEEKKRKIEEDKVRVEKERVQKDKERKEQEERDAKDRAHHEKRVADAENEVAARAAAEGHLKKRLDSERDDHAAASKTYEEQLADVMRTEAQLKIAAENLRKYRRPPHVDNDGGVYYEDDDKHRSGARQVSALAAAAVTIFAMVARF